MNTVYVVEIGDYDEKRIRGVFSTEANARECVAGFLATPEWGVRESWEITEYIVDTDHTGVFHLGSGNEDPIEVL